MQKDGLAKNLIRYTAFAAMVAYIVIMFMIVTAAIFNMNNNPINAVINNLSQSKHITTASISAIEAATSNAISSTTLIVTVAGVFMTVLSIFAAMLVYITNAKLDDVGKKIAEFDTRINVETYMRHVFSGIRYWSKGLYSYALEEFKPGLMSKDNACCLSANYYMGLLYIERFNENKNLSDFTEAEYHLQRAIKFAPDIDPIIVNDSYASFGCLYGLRAEKDFDSPFRDDYLNKSEEFIKKSIDSFGLAVHYKNLAITYALKNNIGKSIECLEKGIERDAEEKGVIDQEMRKEKAREFIGIGKEKVLFSEKEKELIPDICEEIIDYFVRKYC
ncbi:Tetratricopeptide domain protein [Desulfofarcimen acetoxidans DSM 771]|uniref:Tetratricopeptide domain protein n=1 Tax=Desulfofarcimen acetoxidans (strain ATCC 49208 / DSM 771 / KCTC 5769 / VKM B-1644 / 5575) TaxID=485916 RepID=C8VVJ9_DESAS|nr:hypothetical protein [Desulfofarcimen acetoxidans]ACV62314.1 Tetratricopeptide domain protein [Desulfofarcimen acetoxidans DSM 771]